jgi:hypothetical protein
MGHPLHNDVHKDLHNGMHKDVHNDVHNTEKATDRDEHMGPRSVSCLDCPTFLNLPLPKPMDNLDDSLSCLIYRFVRQEET